ncbi:NAD(P)/FAD-dependent oxidoreductase [Methylovulum psychrotolerans]|uniref:Tryptophan halogenase n=1 Tax=Methylovulum psychrotolerans TaxID=1704499 RepID=A0A2S5CGW1_9GAMM|nr:NAD(P)/FAD-dependent oxidoreductase [Methylovulum psychrotolerans]POZ50053.1 tryptophan halogenase [Methylovulum psychrotolerans]
MPSIKNVAIIGGGPASSALAIHLCRQGCKVAIFAMPERASILVGESLVPMIVPLLQELDVEAEVASYSQYKPGACFTYNADEVFEFRFADTPSDLPSYSYNVPRDRFNATLLAAAQRAGAKLIAHHVQLSRVADTDWLTFDAQSLAAAAGCWDAAEPDLIVDAAGRANLIGRLLNIPMQKGLRQDVALFAHVDKTELVDPGYVHNDRMDQGWCWRIPLPGRVSFGFVVPEAYAFQHGETPEEQYEQLLKTDTVLRRLAPEAKRVTEVLCFRNYQSISDRICGENWVMLGDAGGFVDPVFSSGMLIALDSAKKLSAILLANKPLADYETVTRRHLAAWFEIVSYYYDGRLMGSIKAGQTMPVNRFTRWLLAWVSARVSRIFSGAAASNPFCLNLLRFLVKYTLIGLSPERYKIN